MINDVYNSKLLSLAGNIQPNGRLGQADASATAHSKLCGSHIIVDICVGDDGTISAYAHEVKACALGQAAASAVAQHAIGASPIEILEARDAMSAMLKANGGPPTGRFVDLQYLQPVKDYPARHASTMLVLDALADALSKVGQPAATAAE